MDELAYDLNKMVNHNRDGSFKTQADRQNILQMCAKQLKEGGFRHMKATSLKPKHSVYLVEKWQKEGISTGAIKNRMACLRWWAEKVGKQNVVASSNATYLIANREYSTNKDKSIKLTGGNLDKIENPYVKFSVRLQAEFGLRREEAMKFNASYADKGNLLSLKGSWCKNGRPREVPVRFQNQRQLLNEVRQFAGNGSLIPPDKQYRQHLKVFERETSKAGISRTHGLRHQYAQTLYAHMTKYIADEVRAASNPRFINEHPIGWQCPAKGGPSYENKFKFPVYRDMATVDLQARKIVAQEMGHNRTEVTNIYLGK